MCFAACTFLTSQLPKVVRAWCALYILTWKCASRQHGTRFLNISTSISDPNPSVFNTFEHQNVLRATTACTFSQTQHPKVLRRWGVCTFWLPNVLCATTACNFSPLISPDGSAPAALASPLFDAPEPQNVAKTHCFPTVQPFRAPWSSFFCLSLLWYSFSINNETEFILNVFFYDPSHKHTLTNIPCHTLPVSWRAWPCLHSFGPTKMTQGSWVHR